MRYLIPLAAASVPAFVGLIAWRLRGNPLRHDWVEVDPPSGTWAVRTYVEHSLWGIPFPLLLAGCIAAPLILAALLIRNRRRSR